MSRCDRWLAVSALILGLLTAPDCPAADSRTDLAGRVIVLANASDPDSVRLALELDLGRIIPVDQPLEVGIAAVIQLAGIGPTYWALTHGGPQPDFHRRESFIVALSA